MTKSYRSLADVEHAPEGRAVAVGMFDGVHIGHRALLKRLAEIAQAEGSRSCVLTFANHPLYVLRPEECPPLITAWWRKLEILTGLGIDDVVLIEFTRECASLTAEVFVTEVLGSRLDARTVVGGPNFRFGQGAAGTPQTIEALGGPLGIRTRVVEIVRNGKEIASSTALRSLLAEGDVQSAGRMLGEPFVLSGIVEPGARRGAELGFATANMRVPRGLVVPGDGVYACEAECRGERRRAAVSIGSRPTFGGGETVIETHIMDYLEQDLYGEELTLRFVTRLRGQRRYDHVEDLVRQMREDGEAARRALGEPRVGPAG